MMCGKRSSMVLALLLVACVSLSAFPMFWGNSDKRMEVEIEVIPETVTEPAEVEVVEVVEPVAEPEAVPTASTVEPPCEEPSVEEPDETLQMLTELSANYSNEKKLNRQELEELLGLLKIINEDVATIIADADETEARLLEVQDLNAKQADDLAYLTGLYDKEMKTKAYAKAGGVIGFRDNLPTWGVNAAIGARFGKGLLCEMGAQYMVGSFTGILPASLDNLSISASIGWEW